MARAALLHLLRYRTASAAAAAEPLSAFRCQLMTRSNSKTPAAGIKWAGFCRPFSSKAALNDVIGNDTDSSVAVMEPQEQVDPFSLVANELSLIATRLRSMVAAEVPNLASAAEYFFKIGAEGKRFRPTVLLLMATALDVHIPELSPPGFGDTLTIDLRTRQQRIAEITEMIHVASLLHDDVLDDADTRRGVGSLNAVMGNKLAVLAGDFLLSRACLTLASLKNTEVVTLIATVVENLVTGETMQLTTASNKRFSMEYYMQKTYNKTASLMSNSCKSVALLAGHTAEIAMLAFED
ncbi:hypothetical protein ERO13_A07G106000v2 [Gossypium hirsutum]|uniref:Uncharacterized protein n=2 Tax=Gossypium TaxID=3633 RepID=A0A5J5V230_GOSBA|nr:hypothetical protein ES319_A07G115400v1 [Gossypium barbadense]KAG4191618.1 hypothetical protein ERO13_A07G106000v2 [Gossypium hirsutum]TYI18861.1 hypothetical protein ES332_A07G122900v1 [Gossypium tomentosum]